MENSFRLPNDVNNFILNTNHSRTSLSFNFSLIMSETTFIFWASANRKNKNFIRRSFFSHPAVDRFTSCEKAIGIFFCGHSQTFIFRQLKKPTELKTKFQIRLYESVRKKIKMARVREICARKKVLFILAINYAAADQTASAQM